MLINEIRKDAEKDAAANDGGGEQIHDCRTFVFIGVRTNGRLSVHVSTVRTAAVIFLRHHAARPLNPRGDLCRYSPAFDCGDNGGGSTQLALAILSAAAGDDTALLWHKPLRRLLIAGLPKNSPWIVTWPEILATLPLPLPVNNPGGPPPLAPRKRKNKIRVASRDGVITFVSAVSHADRAGSATIISGYAVSATKPAQYGSLYLPPAANSDSDPKCFGGHNWRMCSLYPGGYG